MASGIKLVVCKRMDFRVTGYQRKHSHTMAVCWLENLSEPVAPQSKNLGASKIKGMDYEVLVQAWSPGKYKSAFKGWRMWHLISMDNCSNKQRTCPSIVKREHSCQPLLVFHPMQVSACQACCLLRGWLSYSPHGPTYQTFMEEIVSGTHPEVYFHQFYSLSPQSSWLPSSAITTYDVGHLLYFYLLVVCLP